MLIKIVLIFGEPVIDLSIKNKLVKILIKYLNKIWSIQYRLVSSFIELPKYNS